MIVSTVLGSCGLAESTGRHPAGQVFKPDAAAVRLLCLWALRRGKGGRGRQRKRDRELPERDRCKPAISQGLQC